MIGTPSIAAAAAVLAFALPVSAQSEAPAAPTNGQPATAATSAPEDTPSEPDDEREGELAESDAETEATTPESRPGGYREVDGNEPNAPAPSGAPPPTEAGPYEPPLPAPYAAVEPPLPPVPKHVAPTSSLWLGGKLGWAFPMGEMWRDGRFIDNVSYLLESRAFADFASSGPKAELNIGARLGRRYNLFAHWEYANLGSGDVLENDLGGQNRGHMHFIGGGFRFSSDPDDIGVLIEAVLGYRGFRTSWQSGTALVASDEFLNTRLSFGADIRLSPLLSLSPMLGLAGGFFEEIEWTFADGSKQNALTEFDTFAQHTVITLDVGAHFDLLRSRH